ncbi:MAG: hypothetical protein AVDCRST_MAG59-5071, partial [uncultured Thermomicrobiales bacterium]
GQRGQPPGLPGQGAGGASRQPGRARSRPDVLRRVLRPGTRIVAVGVPCRICPRSPGRSGDSRPWDARPRRAERPGGNGDVADPPGRSGPGRAPV